MSCGRAALQPGHAGVGQLQTAPHFARAFLNAQHTILMLGSETGLLFVRSDYEKEPQKQYIPNYT